MNAVVVMGTLSSAPVTRQLASGSVVVSLEVSTPVEGGGIASVPVAWFDPPAEVEWPPGAELVVLGTVRRRFFRSGGLTQSRTEVVADEVVEARRRRSVDRVLTLAAARLGGERAGAVRSR